MAELVRYTQYAAHVFTAIQWRFHRCYGRNRELLYIAYLAIERSMWLVWMDPKENIIKCPWEFPIFRSSNVKHGGVEAYGGSLPSHSQSPPRKPLSLAPIISIRISFWIIQPFNLPIIYCYYDVKLYIFIQWSYRPPHQLQTLCSKMPSAVDSFKQMHWKMKELFCLALTNYFATQTTFNTNTFQHIHKENFVYNLPYASFWYVLLCNCYLTAKSFW